MEKIKMTTPLVEMDGDEMTRILWKMIKDELILPFVDLKTEYYDLGLPNRDATADKVTMDAALANKKYGVSVKCATITPNAQRMDEYKLHEMWKSPNGTIRAVLDGTVFRAPIMIDSIQPVVKNWKKPITIARHAYGDVYKSVDLYTTEPGECTMTFKGQSGEEKTLLVQKVDGPAVWQGAHNKEKSIRSFARACFQYAIDTKQDLWFSTKDTIAKVYDGTFSEIGGVKTALGVKENAVGLPTATWSMENFSVADYEDLFQKVLNGDITIDNNSEMADPSTAGLSNVSVNYIGG